MKKIGFILMAGALLMAVSCTPSKGKLCDLAKESLEQSLYYPKQLRILSVSEPDSAFGINYLSPKEMKGIMKTMKVVTDSIMARTGNMSSFNPDDYYVISLAERQMKATSEIRDIVFRSSKKENFSGWKVKIDYESVDHDGIKYRSERWTFIDKDGHNVLRAFDIPLP